MDQHQPHQPPAARPLATIIDIPAGTAPSTCAGKTCGAVIYWALHPSSGRAHPVSVECPDGQAPMATRPGRGISHFIDCPDRANFRFRRRDGGAL